MRTPSAQVRRAALVAAIALTAAAVGVALTPGRLGIDGVWCKMTASTGFLLVALAAGALGSRYGIAVLCGLMFSWWGDYFLTRESDLSFLAGLLAFLCGHAAYSIAYLSYRSRGSLALAAFGVLGVLGFALAWRYGAVVPGPMRPWVAAYLAAISFMVALAVGTLPRRGGWLILSGALAFYLSDICVAYRQFIEHRASVSAMGTVLYFGGQVMLAGSIAAVEPGQPGRSRAP